MLFYPLPRSELSTEPVIVPCSAWGNMTLWILPISEGSAWNRLLWALELLCLVRQLHSCYAHHMQHHACVTFNYQQFQWKGKKKFFVFFSIIPWNFVGWKGPIRSSSNHSVTSSDTLCLVIRELNVCIVFHLFLHGMNTQKFYHTNKNFWILLPVTQVLPQCCTGRLSPN